MMKGPLVNYWILALLLFLATGCSSFHEVSVVSHGDEVAPVNEAELEEIQVVALPPPVVDQAPVQISEAAPVSIPPIHAAVPVTSPKASAAGETSVGPGIFAQSREEVALPWMLEDVFFDYDQMELRREAIPHLELNAKVLLKRYADQEVLIQGHCDERGTEAYNLILGERRAMAVKTYLVNLGVADTQLRVLSLGKSQPFCEERTLSCLQLNRRAHFVIK